MPGIQAIHYIRVLHRGSVQREYAEALYSSIYKGITQEHSPDVIPVDLAPLLQQRSLIHDPRGSTGFQDI